MTPSNSSAPKPDPTKNPAATALPSQETAALFLLNSTLKKRKKRHCLKVAQSALRLGIAWGEAGLPPDLDLLVASGLLHDLTKGEDDHASAGRFWAEQHGWPDLGLVIGAHTALPASILKALDVEYSQHSEKVISCPNLKPATFQACVVVFLADKYFKGDQPATISERFEGFKRWHENDFYQQNALEKWKQTALQVEARVKQILKKDPFEIIQHPSSDEVREKFLSSLFEQLTY